MQNFKRIYLTYITHTSLSPFIRKRTCSKCRPFRATHSSARLQRFSTALWQVWDGIARIAAQIAFLSSARVCGFPFYTRDFRYPHRKIGWVQIRGVGWPGMWSVARDHARANALLDELDGPMCGMRGGPSCWNHWMTWVSAHLRCITVTNLLKIQRYRSPVTVWVRPCPSSDQKGPIPSELLTAHHAVQFRLCRGLSLTMLGVVVAQNRLFCVLTLPSSSKLPLSKGYGPGHQVKFNNLHFFLCAIHTHDHDWNWLKHPTQGPITTGWTKFSTKLY